MTETVFYQDCYAQECQARVESIDETGVILDRTVFYPTGGGQPGDSGALIATDGTAVRVVTAQKADGAIAHIVEGDHPLSPGDTVTARIDWERRHRHMRMHTCLHLLCSLIDAPVTGGSVASDKGRLDFDLPESTLDKVQLSEQLAKLVADDHPIQVRWISDEELRQNPELVRTMSVHPPMGQGNVRLIEIDSVDLQPCGGTHLNSTAEIGGVYVRKIEKKGRQNRRVILAFQD